MADRSTGKRSEMPPSPFLAKRSRILLVVLAVSIALVSVEVAFRALLFTQLPWMSRFRQPGLYSNPLSDDYWKLLHAFGSADRQPSRLHPLLGWSGSFDDQLQHLEKTKVENRTPVLLYGDSFAHYHLPKWFQQYFNEDASLNKHCFLLNYGVGGYGLDQIQLLFERSIDGFKRPSVIYSFLLDDIGRALLSVRDHPKPYYAEEGGSLTLRGVPTDRRIDDYLAKNPIGIRSYLWRLLFLNKLPERAAKWMEGDTEIARQTRLARFLLGNAVATARDAEAPILFVIFTEMSAFHSPDWRQAMVEEILREIGAEYISVHRLIADDLARTRRRLPDYFREPPDGHPSDVQNQLVFKALRTHLLPQCE